MSGESGAVDGVEWFLPRTEPFASERGYTNIEAVKQRIIKVLLVTAQVQIVFRVAIPTLVYRAVRGTCVVEEMSLLVHDEMRDMPAVGFKAMNQ